jgi:PAS domain-containing protein
MENVVDPPPPKSLLMNGLVTASLASKPITCAAATESTVVEIGGNEHAWMERIAVPVFSIDMSYRVVAWNRSTVELTGIRASDIVHQPFTSLIQDGPSQDALRTAVLSMEQPEDSSSTSDSLDHSSFVSSSTCEVSVSRGGTRGDGHSASPLHMHLRMSAQHNSLGRTEAIICFVDEIRQRQPPELPPQLQPDTQTSNADDSTKKSTPT